MSVIGTGTTHVTTFLLMVSRSISCFDFAQMQIIIVLSLSSSLSHSDFDPVGVFCIIDKDKFSSPISIHEEFLLNDENYPLRYLELNFRSKSQL